MKFYVGDKMSGMYIKGQIVKEYRDNGNIITLNKVQHILRGKEEGSDFVWNVESKLDKKIRLRECKDGWYLYLPEPEKLRLTTTVATVKVKPPLIGDITVIETDSLERLISTLETIKDILGGCSGYMYRPCIVKAKKSGRKEERQDRNAYFHRWVDLSKGVQQVVALVEFDDGHVEQVQPDRVIFIKEEKKDANIL